jgi:hypothetical protein
MTFQTCRTPVFNTQYMMKRQISLLAVVLWAWLGPDPAAAQTKTSEPALEPVVAALEPVALRTALARPLKDAKRTVIVPAREDAVLGLTSLTKEEFEAAGLNWDQFMTQAAAAATRLLVTIKPVVARDKAGQIAYIKLKSERPYAASMILSPRLIPLFQDFLGDRLVALVPDRHTVYLFSRNFGEFQAFGQKIVDDHADAVYPCSIEAFEISRDGVACLGGFDDGADPLPSFESSGGNEKVSPAPPELPPGGDAKPKSTSTGPKPKESKAKP